MFQPTSIESTDNQIYSKKKEEKDKSEINNSYKKKTKIETKKRQREDGNEEEKKEEEGEEEEGEEERQNKKTKLEEKKNNQPNFLSKWEWALYNYLMQDSKLIDGRQCSLSTKIVYYFFRNFPENSFKKFKITTPSLESDDDDLKNIQIDFTAIDLILDMTFDDDGFRYDYRFMARQKYKEGHIYIYLTADITYAYEEDKEKEEEEELEEEEEEELEEKEREEKKNEIKLKYMNDDIDGKIYLSKNVELFMQDIQLTDCFKEEIYTYLENVENIKFKNRKLYYCTACNNTFKHRQNTNIFPTDY